jgi:hypothetical protein
MVLKAIEQQVGGTALATANDSDKMKVAFSQLSESIGLTLLPIFQKFTAIMLKVSQFAAENTTVIVISWAALLPGWLWLYWLLTQQ